MGTEKVPSLFILASFLFALPVFASALTGDVQLNSPANMSWTNKTNSTLPFVIRYTDPGNATADCVLYMNTPWQPKGSVTAKNGTDTQVYASEAFKEGENVWGVTCTNGSGIGSGNYTFYADTGLPSVGLVSPSNASSVASGSVSFRFNYLDAVSPRASCSVYANQILRATNASVSNNVETVITASLGAGSYSWYVGCVDLAGNSGKSTTFDVSVEMTIGLTIVSPQNKTYNYLQGIPLKYTVSGAPAWTGYSLDGSANTTLTGNRTFNVGSEGQHLIELYANDSLGRTAYKSVHFTVYLDHQISFVSPAGNYSRDWVLVNVSIDTDAIWCGLSLDGGGNVSMSNVSARSWLRNLTSLSSGTHEVDVWCNDSYGPWTTGKKTFSVTLGDVSMNLKSPENKTYWNTSKLDFRLTSISDMRTCEYYLNSEGPVLLNNYSSRDWYYNSTGLSGGSYELKVQCRNPNGFLNSTSVAFTIDPAQCESNVTGICTDAQQCVGGSCLDIGCIGCSYAANHKCQPYECCSNDDCLAEQECLSNACTTIACGCGNIQNHACIEYDCCSNFDCEADQRCDTSTHSCLGSVLKIEAPGTVYAGQTFTVKVTDKEGTALEGVTIEMMYPSDSVETLTTDDKGTVTAVAKETGSLAITARMSGYDAKTVTQRSPPDSTGCLWFSRLSFWRPRAEGSSTGASSRPSC